MKSSTVALVVILVGILCFLMAACVLGLALGLIAKRSGELDLGASPQTGQIAPDFQLENIDGGNVSLGEFRGRPVMVNFWAVWCDPCIEEMPIIQQRYQQHHPDLVVLAIEENGNSPGVRELIKEEGLTFIVLGGEQAVAQQYNIYAFPTSIFIDAHGVIRGVHIGSLSEPALDKELAKIGVGD